MISFIVEFLQDAVRYVYAFLWLDMKSCKRLSASPFLYTLPARSQPRPSCTTSGIEPDLGGITYMQMSRLLAFRDRPHLSAPGAALEPVELE
jgi:hypothetical protein